MRNTNDNPTDPLGSLGAPMRETKPAPAPAPVAPHIVRNADGTLSTALPEPAPLYFGSATFYGFTVEEVQALATAVSACTISAEELAGIADADSVAPAK